MKTFELTKGVQIVLIALFVIVIGAIIVGLLTNDEVMAASCSSCNKTIGVNSIAGTTETTHIIDCDNCHRILFTEK